MKKWNKNPNDEFVIKGSKVDVYNNDVNGALRRMKKILERNNWQKDVLNAKLSGKWPLKPPADTKYMKSKRKRRRVSDAANLFESAQRQKK